MQTDRQKKKKICFVVAVIGTAKSFLINHINELAKYYDIYLVGNFSETEDLSSFNLSASKSININRDISITTDFKAVYELYKYFRKEKFDAVHSVTPKAGLITAIAARLANIKHRTHIFTGQVWAARQGVMRFMLKTFDRLIFLFNNHILVDGEPQRQFLIKNKIISAKKSQVLGAGSISGVDTNKFVPSLEIRNKIRSELNILNDRIVYAFLGRLNKDKGIYELFDAFNSLTKICPNTYLLLIGNDEENCIDKLSNYKNIKPDINFKFYGRTPHPNIVLQAADVLCMPSYREGFGSSVIEAQCLGIPAICSDIYGLSDTIVDNETGLRCKVKDWTSLFISMKKLYDNPDLIDKYGNNGRLRVLEIFSAKTITQEWIDFYSEILSDK